MVKRFRRNTTSFINSVVEYQPGYSWFFSSSTIIHRIYLAGLFRLDSVILYSFSAALHSVFKSWANENWFKTACWAAWIASAGLIPLERNSSSSAFGRSIQTPVVSRSQAGVSRSTASRITLFLYCRLVEEDGLELKIYLILKNPFYTLQRILGSKTMPDDAYRKPWLQ